MDCAVVDGGDVVELDESTSLLEGAEFEFCVEPEEVVWGEEIEGIDAGEEPEYG